MKIRTWGQGNHIISMILIQPCGCGETVWLMTKRKDRTAVYECINPKCRSVLTVELDFRIEMNRNLGKPMPNNPLSLKFYEQFTKAQARAALDVSAGQKLKCFICGAAGSLTGPLKQTPLVVVGIMGLQLRKKELAGMCCEICRAWLVRDYIVQCGQVDCTHWKRQSKSTYLKENAARLVIPEVLAAFKQADIVFGPGWECDQCRAIRTGWAL